MLHIVRVAGKLGLIFPEKLRLDLTVFTPSNQRNKAITETSRVFKNSCNTGLIPR